MTAATRPHLLSLEEWDAWGRMSFPMRVDLESLR